MAKVVGRNGVLKIGAVTVAGLKSISESESCEAIDDSELGDQELTYVAGDITRNYTAELHWDKADATGQGALEIGATVTAVYQPEGDASGAETNSISALVTNLGRANEKGSMVTKTATLLGSGAKTVGAVV